VVAHGVASVSGITGHHERVVVGFGADRECVIIGHVDDAIRSRLNETPQFIASFPGQLVKQVVAEPVVASGIIESDFELRPRTIEEVGAVNVLLDQQCNAVGCEMSKTKL